MSYDEKSFTEDWREIESLFSGKCFQCHDELLEWRFDFYWDKIARREATEVLFEWHTLGHGWWLDDTNEDITGLYLVKKNIAWREYRGCVSDIEYTTDSLQAVSSCLLSQKKSEVFLSSWATSLNPTMAVWKTNFKKPGKGLSKMGNSKRISSCFKSFRRACLLLC